MKMEYGHVINNVYIVRKGIKEGSTCMVYEGINQNNDNKVAIKVVDETKFADKDDTKSTVMNEYSFYTRLQHVKGIPKIHLFGEVDEKTVLVMDLLGPIIVIVYDLLLVNKISPSSVRNYYQQLMSIFGGLHQNGVAHNDVKAANIVTGANAGVVHLIDFGEATEADIQSVKEDLMNIGCVLLSCLKGELIWGDEEDGISGVITDATPNCQQLRQAFNKYFNYIEGLQMGDTVDFNYLKNLMP